MDHLDEQWRRFSAEFLEATGKVIASTGRKHLIGTGDAVKVGEEFKHYNSAWLFNEKGENTHIYNKIQIVPYGEYMPFKDMIPASWWTKLDEMRGMGTSLSRGENFSTFKIRDDVIIGINICFEDCFPYVSHEFVKRGANVLVTLTNDSWFGLTSGGHQHTAQSIFRAIENNLPLVRAGNTCESCLVMPDGTVTNLLVAEDGSRFTRGYQIVDVPVITNPQRTFYQKNPWFFRSIIIFGACLIFAAILLHFFRKKATLAAATEQSN